MKQPEALMKKKRPIKKIIAGVLLIVLSIVGLFLYRNFNRLVSEALLNTFNTNLISDVYELKFENLRVNLFEGSIRVNKVVLQARKKPLQYYPYINSSFLLKTEKIILKKVQLMALLKEGKMELEQISITKPEIHLYLNGKQHVLFPYKDSSQIEKPKNQKKAIVGFKLKQFSLIDASFYGNNS